MGQPLYCSAAADAGVWGERGYGAGSTPYAGLSSTALLPWLPNVPPQAFPTTISSFTTPWSVSPQSTAALALGLLHNPYAPAPSRCAFSGTCMPVQGTNGCGKDCLVLIPFRLLECSCFTLSLKCFSTEPDSCPSVGTGPLLQFPYLPRASPVQLTRLFSLLVPLSQRVLTALYILFWWSGTRVHSQLVFCKHFCVSRCIPDVSMERDVLHVHLLFRQLVLSLRTVTFICYICRNIPSY